MNWDLRPLQEEEVATSLILERRVLGLPSPTEAQIADLKRERESERTISAWDRGQLVASAVSFALPLTVPGPVVTTAVGITAAVVRPTHRRQGLLTAILRRQLEDSYRREEAVAILGASEGSIYGRFGFGVATYEAE
ncbi:MAG: GNAT family N-acetyltransferase, partial [Candidatus Dormibacteraceae bacterium]